jgi:hypothetical protein
MGPDSPAAGAGADLAIGDGFAPPGVGQEDAQDLALGMFEGNLDGVAAMSGTRTSAMIAAARIACWRDASCATRDATMSAAAGCSLAVRTWPAIISVCPSARMAAA